MTLPTPRPQTAPSNPARGRAISVQQRYLLFMLPPMLPTLVVVPHPGYHPQPITRNVRSLFPVMSRTAPMLTLSPPSYQEHLIQHLCPLLIAPPMPRSSTTASCIGYHPPPFSRSALAPGQQHYPLLVSAHTLSTVSRQPPTHPPLEPFDLCHQDSFLCGQHPHTPSSFNESTHRSMTMAVYENMLAIMWTQ